MMTSNQNKDETLPVLSELASLIGSLDIDSPYTRPSREIVRPDVRDSADTNAFRAELIKSHGLESSLLKDLIESVDYPMEEKKVTDDREDYSVIQYGSAVTIRGKHGRYLTSIPTSATTKADTKGLVYMLGIDGQGVGEACDTLILVNAENRDSVGSVKYGDTVCVKSPSAKDRYLGIRDGSRLGFWRSLIGTGEKFLLLKASPRGTELRNTRGSYARIGDRILLMTTTEQLITISETLSGTTASLIHRDRAGVGGEVWQVERVGSVPMPLWMTERPFLCGSYIFMSDQEKYAVTADVLARTFPGASVAASITTPLADYGVAVQEQILLREVLWALSGLEGTYIRTISTSSISHPHTKMAALSLTVDADTCDRGLSSQVMQLLPICDAAIRIRYFIRLHLQYDYGTVSQAAATSIQKLMCELDTLITNFEHLFNTKQLSIQKITYLLHPTKSTIFILDKLVARLLDSTGGAMLNLIHTGLLEQGDEKARLIYERVLTDAAEPFLSMLSRWLYLGILDDAVGEFLIQVNASLSKEALQEDFNAHYWEARYTLRNKHIPGILQRHAEKVLIAGKYLNVLRDLALQSAVSHMILRHDMPALVFDVNGTSSLTAAVEEAYAFSSGALLRVLEETYGVSSHLRSLRRFFLLETGDFFVQFMDAAGAELTKEVKHIAVNRIQTLLQMSIASCTLSMDVHRDDFTCGFASHNLIQHLHLIQTAGEGLTPEGYSILGGVQGLKGIEALTLEYNVGWPVSILLSRRAITKYQLLSRLLFFSKHVELRVLECWQSHQTTKEFKLRSELGASYCLRHRMLHFLQNFVYYITYEVIVPRSHAMEEAMKSAHDMDELLAVHEGFLDACLRECLLASQELLRILTKLTTTCLLFADQMKRFSGSNEVLEPELRALHGDAAGKSFVVRKSRIRVQSDIIRKEVTHEAYLRMLAKFEDTFDSQLGEFLEKLWADSNRHHAQLSNLCVRLDYNGYYASKFSEQQQTSFSMR